MDIASPGMEKFCLQWNDHHRMFFTAAETLSQAGQLTDVTLAAGGSVFPAHRLVLSVCSPFFKVCGSVIVRVTN